MTYICEGHRSSLVNNLLDLWGDNKWWDADHTKGREIDLATVNRQTVVNPRQNILPQFLTPPLPPLIPLTLSSPRLNHR